MDVDIEVEDGTLRLVAEPAQQAIDIELGPGWFASSWDLVRGLSVQEVEGERRECGRA